VLRTSTGSCSSQWQSHASYLLSVHLLIAQPPRYSSIVVKQPEIYQLLTTPVIAIVYTQHITIILLLIDICSEHEFITISCHHVPIISRVLLYRQIQFIINLCFLWIDSFQNLCNGCSHLFLGHASITRLELLYKILRCHWFAHQIPPHCFLCYTFITAPTTDHRLR